MAAMDAPRRLEDITVPEELPILPTQEAVLYPHMILPLAVSDEKSMKLMDDVVAGRRLLAVFALRDSQQPPSPANLHEVGSAAYVARMLRIPDGPLQVLLQGAARVRLLQITQEEPYLSGRLRVLPEPEEKSTEVVALQRNLLGLFQRAASLSPAIPDEAGLMAANTPQPGRLADLVAATLTLSVKEKQDILETVDVSGRLRKVTGYINRELEVLEIGSRIQSQIKEQMEKGQREYYLREQLKAIQKELGEVDERETEINELRQRLAQANLPEDARKEAERELDRFSRIPPASPEHGMIRTYLDWVLALPWATGTEDQLDVQKAREVLDEDHYDLDRVKERILEYLAVRKLKRDTRGPILCFIGPPGVGKTSLGQSIARAMGRKFVRMSLGGIRDEAEIRGHRRTYIASMPGRIIQGIRRAGSNNPVFMLDEVDKLAVGFQGDPAAALLEVLDPAQNSSFTDNYLGVPFDLSKVMFIATANMADTIPSALWDRMEVLSLPGYTDAEKLHIARRYLVPRQLAENGLQDGQITFTDDSLQGIIANYTREAGLRNLERNVATICRRVGRRIAEGEVASLVVTSDSLGEFLGPPRFRHEAAEREDEVGVAAGLAVTPVGGEVLFVEATAVPGGGNLILTGQLGDVMQESAKAAFTYARSRADILDLAEDFYQRVDIHIHVPAGAVPKDGPSAGITMATALISALTRRPVRRDIGMTGEITLRGKVLPIGGLKEKVLAGHRAGLATVIIPKENERDLEEVPAEVREVLHFVPVEHMDEVLANALSARKVGELQLAATAPPAPATRAVPEAVGV